MSIDLYELKADLAASCGNNAEHGFGHSEQVGN